MAGDRGVGRTARQGESFDRSHAELLGGAVTRLAGRISAPCVSLPEFPALRFALRTQVAAVAAGDAVEASRDRLARHWPLEAARRDQAAALGPSRRARTTSPALRGVRLPFSVRACRSSSFNPRQRPGRVELEQQTDVAPQVPPSLLRPCVDEWMRAVEMLPVGWRLHMTEGEGFERADRLLAVESPGALDAGGRRSDGGGVRWW